MNEKIKERKEIKTDWRREQEREREREKERMERERKRERKGICIEFISDFSYFCAAINS